jgi:hypothetical protein
MIPNSGLSGNSTSAVAPKAVATPAGHTNLDLLHGVGAECPKRAAYRSRLMTLHASPALVVVTLSTAMSVGLILRARSYVTSTQHGVNSLFWTGTVRDYAGNSDVEGCSAGHHWTRADGEFSERSC